MTDYFMQGLGGYGADFIRSLDETFGRHARERREFLEYPQEIVALMMQASYGISWHQTVVAKIESGARKVKLTEAYALADMYGISLEDLTHGKELASKVEWTHEMLPNGRKVVRVRRTASGEHSEEA